MVKSTTMTFSVGKQTNVQVVNDPDQPGREQLLAKARRFDREEEWDREEDRLFGTRIREAIRVLKRR